MVSECATQIAHLLEDQSWVVEGDLDWIGVPACVAFIIELQVFHELFPLLVGWHFAFLCDLIV